MAMDPSAIGKVIGAYDDPEKARRAARKAQEASARVEVHPATAADVVASLRSEMREEMRHTIIGPGNIGPFTKEMQKGMARMVPLSMLVGALLLLPFGFIPVADFTLASRLLIAGVIGAVAGAVTGFIIGGGTRAAEKEPDTMAAERGTLVVAELTDPAAAAPVAEAMAEDAIRVDMVTLDEVPVGDVTTEEERERSGAEERTQETAKDRAEVLRDPTAR